MYLVSYSIIERGLYFCQNRKRYDVLEITLCSAIVVRVEAN
jgi:hypothetical protein